MQEGVHPCQNGPQIPMENPLEARGVPETACPTASSGLQEVAMQPKPRGPCRGRGHPPAHVLPAGWLPPTTSALLHPLLRRVARGGPGVRQNGGQVWAVLCSSYHPPRPPPGSGRGRNGWASAPALYAKHTKRRIVTTISVNEAGQIQPWRKREPSRWLQGRGARATPQLDLGLESARTARSTRPGLQQTASLHEHQRLANPPHQCTARKRFRKA